MSSLLLALALSRNAGLFSVDNGIIAEAVSAPSPARNSYVSIQDDGLFVSYTDDNCRFDQKTGGCVGGTSLLGILDTAGQEDVTEIVVGAEGGALSIWGDATGHYDFQGGCQERRGDFACSHAPGFAPDVHCFEWEGGVGSPDFVYNLQVHQEAGWNALVKTEATGRRSAATLDETVACAAFGEGGGAPVAVTFTTLQRTGDGFMDYTDESWARTVATGTLSYRGSWVE